MGSVIVKVTALYLFLPEVCLNVFEVAGCTVSCVFVRRLVDIDMLLLFATSTKEHHHMYKYNYNLWIEIAWGKSINVN